MVRTRLARLLVAGALLSSGCTYLAQHPLFSKHSDACIEDGADGACYDGGQAIGSAGPILGDGGAGAFPQAPTACNPSVMPQNTIPPLTSPPRLTPQPEAPRTPYTPTNRDWR